MKKDERRSERKGEQQRTPRDLNEEFRCVASYAANVAPGSVMDVTRSRVRPIRMLSGNDVEAVVNHAINGVDLDVVTYVDTRPEVIAVAKALVEPREALDKFEAAAKMNEGVALALGPAMDQVKAKISDLESKLRQAIAMPAGVEVQQNVHKRFRVVLAETDRNPAQVTLGYNVATIAWPKSIREHPATVFVPMGYSRQDGGFLGPFVDFQRRTLTFVSITSGDKQRRCELQFVLRSESTGRMAFLKVVAAESILHTWEEFAFEFESGSLLAEEAKGCNGVLAEALTKAGVLEKVNGKKDESAAESDGVPEVPEPGQKRDGRDHHQKPDDVVDGSVKGRGRRKSRPAPALEVDVATDETPGTEEVLAEPSAEISTPVDVEDDKPVGAGVLAEALKGLQAPSSEGEAPLEGAVPVEGEMPVIGEVRLETGDAKTEQARQA